MSTTIEPKKISGFVASLITINIMLGAGIFINITQLAHIAGPISIFSYPIVGLLLLPLILTFTKLLSIIPGATFYEIGSLLHPAIGFITTWGYFIGKLASAALGLHVFTSSVSLIFPVCTPYVFLMEISVLACFGCLIFFSLKTGLPMQLFFLILKAIPLICGILSGFAFMQMPDLTSCPTCWQNLPATFPLVLFAFAGFEATCSLGNQIANAKKNAPRIILFSFFTTLILVSLLQIVFVCALHNTLPQMTDFRQPFITLFSKAFTRYPLFLTIITNTALAGIASSALGSSYSILSSNIWNLHTLAKHNTLPGSSQLIRINSFNTPVLITILAIFAEILYLIGTNSNIYTLQRISVSANILACTSGTLAFLHTTTTKNHRLLGLCALGTCAIFIYTAVQEGLLSGFAPYGFYIGLLGLGYILYRYAKHIPKRQPC